MAHTILSTRRLAAALSRGLGVACALPAMAPDVGERNQEKAKKG